MRRPLLFATILACLALVSPDARAGSDAGPLKIGGTGAALQFSRVMAEESRIVMPETEIAVYEGLGSGGGIRAVAAGALDLAITSRPLKQSEAALDLVSQPLLVTPFGFFTSRHQPVNVHARDVPRLYSGESCNCSDFGDAIIRIVLRPHAESDTDLAARYFEGLGAQQEAARALPGVPVAITDQDNAELAQQLENSLTTGTLLQMLSEHRDLRPLLIDGVAPSVAAMQDGSYPYSKTFYLIRRADTGATVQRFIDFLSSDEAAPTMERMGAVALH